MNVRLYKYRSPKAIWHENLLNITEMYEEYKVDGLIYINYN